FPASRVRICVLFKDASPKRCGDFHNELVNLDERLVTRTAEASEDIKAFSSNPIFKPYSGSFLGLGSLLTPSPSLRPGAGAPFGEFRNQRAGRVGDLVE